MSRFVQTAPALGDPYTGDHVLRSYLDRYLGSEGAAGAATRLAAVGADVATRLRDAHADAEAHPPMLRRYDAWGERIDRIETAAGWEDLRRAAARHALVALPYQDQARRAYGGATRVVQHALLHVYGPESATFSCPVAMSDGAATLLSLPGVDPAVRDAFLPQLLSTDPHDAITSGQWMTEAQGGSDLSGTTTSARRDGDGWRLTGEKWFCSAADAPIAVALARPEGAGGGTRVLAPFVVARYAGEDVRPPAANARPADGVVVHRLKDKLGTRALPTAEIGLSGARAYPIGDPYSGGLARMMTLVVITRLHNAAAAAGGMRRGLDYVRAYSAVRTVMGARLDAHPLHRATLARLAVDAEAAYALTAHAFALLGAVEVDGSTAAADELRLVAPIAKIATARWAVASASEYVEGVGGAGYIEDTGIPRLLRDAQVLPIWEGTSNVLASDVVRVIGRGEAGKHLLARVDEAIDVTSGETAAAMADARTRLGEAFAAAAREPHAALAGARDLALASADLLTAALLAQQAAFETRRGDPHGAAVLDLWAAARLSRHDIGPSAAAVFDTVVDRH